MVDFGKSLDNVNGLVYDDVNSTMDGGATMTSKEVLAAVLKATGKTQAEAATNVGWVPQQLSARLVRNSLRADELLALLEGLGVELSFTIKETGEKVD